MNSILKVMGSHWRILIRKVIRLTFIKIILIPFITLIVLNLFIVLPQLECKVYENIDYIWRIHCYTPQYLYVTCSK